MKERYQVFVSARAEQMLTSHVCFLARVSVKAARRLRNAYADMLAALEENPYQFPIVETLDLPGQYRKALFGKRYQAIFCVEDTAVFLDAVLDCRMEDKGNY